MSPFHLNMVWYLIVNIPLEFHLNGVIKWGFDWGEVRCLVSFREISLSINILSFTSTTNGMNTIWIPIKFNLDHSTHLKLIQPPDSSTGVIRKLHQKKQRRRNATCKENPNNWRISLHILLKWIKFRSPTRWQIKLAYVA